MDPSTKEALNLVMAYRSEMLDLAKTLWEQYLNWYGFYCGFNILGLGFVYEKSRQRIRHNPVVWAFILADLLAVSWCFVFTRYAWSISECLNSTGARLFEESREALKADPKIFEGFSSVDSIPFREIQYASVCTSVTMLALLFIWLIIVSFPKLLPETPSEGLTESANPK